MWLDYFVKIFYLVSKKKTKNMVIAQKTRVNYIIESKNSTSNCSKKEFFKSNKDVKGQIFKKKKPKKITIKRL